MYDKHMTNVCVRLFLENWEKYTMGFMNEFQKLTVSDEKVSRRPGPEVLKLFHAQLS